LSKTPDWMYSYICIIGSKFSNFGAPKSPYLSTHIDHHIDLMLKDHAMCLGFSKKLKLSWKKEEKKTWHGTTPSPSAILDQASNLPSENCCQLRPPQPRRFYLLVPPEAVVNPDHHNHTAVPSLCLHQLRLKCDPF